MSSGQIPYDDNSKPVLALWNDATGQAIPVHVKSTVTGADGKTYGILDTGSSGGGGGAVTDLVATGTITAAQATEGTAVANATVALALGTGQATWEAQITGLGSGSTIAFDGVDDVGTSTNWQAAVGYQASIINPPPITSIAGPGLFIIRGTSSGYQQIRVRCTVYNGTDTIAVRLLGSVGGLAGAGGLVSNDGTFAKESGGNLATIATNTTGVATAANQATANTSLSAIATNTTGLATDAHASSIVTNTANIPAKGQSTMSGSMPVALASDQTPLTSATATRTNVAGANSDTALLASNTARKGALFFNDSTATLYLAYGSGAASLTSYSVQIAPNGFFELPSQPIFTGAIRGIWSAANGNVRITELS